MSSGLPAILVVEQELGSLRGPSRVLESEYRVVTCTVEKIALEYVREARPAAVLLDANAFYLEGPGVLERWREASRLSRVLLIDSDGPWVLLMALEGAESGEMAITPCTVDEMAPAIGELLGREGSELKERDDGPLAFVAV